MAEVIRSTEFTEWLDGLKDEKAKGIIVARILRLQAGILGDVEPVGDGVSELRIHYGPGYRLYFMQRGPAVVVLLLGGDKSTQAKDIKATKNIAADWR